MNKSITQKIKVMPKTPGVYLFRDTKGKVIYVGKAVSLKNRVSSYFNKQEKDPKTAELVRNIVKIDTIETGSEFEALILESDLVKRYKPKYNIRLRDDKSYVYLKITKEDYPRISVVHQITGETAEYLGPYIDPRAVRSILKIARKIFPYCSCSKMKDDVCLYYHLGLCPGHSDKYISKGDYAKNIQGIRKLFTGKTSTLKKEFQKGMKQSAKTEDFELAGSYRNKLYSLDRIERSHFISERDLSADVALVQLKKELDLPILPARIECYDISNIMGTSAVGSMVVFKNGIASPKDYRRFQIRTVKGANDFAMLAEVMARRFKDNKTRRHPERAGRVEGSNKKEISPLPSLGRNDKVGWSLPDLVILDGGKGQLSTVLKNVEIPEGVKVVALAKRKEEVFSLANYDAQITNPKQVPNSNFKNSDLNSNFKFQISNLAEGSEAFFLIQRIRDEAHRFAVTYHRKVKSREMYETSLDAIPGIGPKTKKKLLKEFGSINNIKEASSAEISIVVGEKLSQKIKETL